MNATGLGAVAVVLTILTAGAARASGGTVTIDGDRAVLVGQVWEGVVVVNDVLAFALHKEGLGFVPDGSWIRVEGTLLPGAQRRGRGALVRLQQDFLELIDVDASVTADGVGITDVIDGGPYEKAPGDPAKLLQAAVGSALADGRLERDEWASLQAAWRRVERNGKARGEAARWLTSRSDAHRALYTGLCGGMPWEVVARLLGQATTIVPATPPAAATPAAVHDAALGGPQPLNAGRWAGRALNELFEELKGRLDELKAAVRERVRALNAQGSLTRAQVEEVYDLYQASAAVGAAYGAVSAVLTEEGGDAAKAWQASRCTGGRARVYVNYQALGGR